MSVEPLFEARAPSVFGVDVWLFRSVVEGFDVRVVAVKICLKAVHRPSCGVSETYLVRNGFRGD